MREYVIAGSYGEYIAWRRANLERASRAHYLSEADDFERMEPGVVHRAPGWERSPVLERALELEQRLT